MNDLIELIYVPGDLIQTLCRSLILVLSIDLVLGFGALIGDSKNI